MPLPKPNTIPTTLLLLSDTHLQSPPPPFSPTAHPKIDILIHTGDLTNNGTLPALRSAIEFLASIPAELKLVVAGNHDIDLDLALWAGREHRDSSKERGQDKEAQEEETKEVAKKEKEKGKQGESASVGTRHSEAIALMTGPLAKSANIHYLPQGTHTFTLSSGARFRVYASPYTPHPSSTSLCGGGMDWAFGYPRSEDRFNPPSQTTSSPPYPPSSTAAKTTLTNSVIPADVDIILTHGPPRGILDLSASTGETVGCQHLYRALERVRPVMHVFGHVHESAGVEVVDWREREAHAKSNQQDETGGKSKRKNDVVHRFFEEEEVENPYPEVYRWRGKKGEGKTLCVNASVMDGGFEARNLPWCMRVDLPVA
ncbi:MAG: hypothetical protein Q9220_004383 [cf. Caloplaca sp. 1 TL-2023]